MKENWPRTYNYLSKFESILLNSSLYKHFHMEAKNPFYGERDISSFTFLQYKVVWRRQSDKLFATVISHYKTPFGYKLLIPLDPIAFFATDNESEAHYLCAIINSRTIHDFIKSFSSAGRGFGTPSVMEYVGIPKFDSDNTLHNKLSEISKKCHQLKLEGKESEIENLEKENEILVKELFHGNG